MEKIKVVRQNFTQAVKGGAGSESGRLVTEFFSIH